MQADWMSVEHVAEVLGISVSDAMDRAEREHWPRVFKTDVTLVLVPGDLKR